MLIKFNCPYCDAELGAESTQRGHAVDCVECENEFTIPLQGAIGIGNIIDEHLITEFLGEGAMGRVYKAEHQIMGRSVALKTISPKIRFDKDAEMQFLRELQMSAILSHPNIVTTYNAGHTEGVFYVTMQYVEGLDLGYFVKEEGDLPEKECVRMAKAMAEALEYAWEDHGMMHRDIKPDNILLDTKRRYTLMDFGVAQMLGEENDGFIVGTPDFISPEAAQAHDVDFRTDMYSLGCVMIHCLSGKRLFEGSIEEVLHAQIHEDTPTVEELNPDIQINSRLQDILDIMTNKDPDDRFASWGDCIKALSALDENKPVAPAASSNSKLGMPKSKTKTKRGPKLSASNVKATRRAQAMVNNNRKSGNAATLVVVLAVVAAFVIIVIGLF